MSKATEALENVIHSLMFLGRRNFGPGQYIGKMNDKVREKLSQLKSEELTNLRSDACVSDSEEVRRKKEVSDMLIKFDKEMLKIT